MTGTLDTNVADDCARLGRMKALLCFGNDSADAGLDRRFFVERENGRTGSASGLWIRVFFLIAGSVVVQAGESCDAHSKCVFGNCAHRSTVFVKLHNTASLACSDPWVILVGTHDVVSKADSETQRLVARVRGVCPDLRPRPAYCTRSVVKTKEDTFLISTTTAIVILRYFQLAGTLAAP